MIACCFIAFRDSRKASRIEGRYCAAIRQEVGPIVVPGGWRRPHYGGDDNSFCAIRWKRHCRPASAGIVVSPWLWRCPQE